jgi:hypothetical protein
LAELLEILDDRSAQEASRCLKGRVLNIILPRYRMGASSLRFL